MSTSDPNKTFINGPVNVVRLEGEIDGIKKVMYLFMDFHADVQHQHECNDIFSTDIQKYFAESFYNLNNSSKIYDFFCEIGPERGLLPSGEDYLLEKDMKEGYISEVFKLFKKIFRYNKKKNKVTISNLFKNVRLHYTDFRMFIFIHIWDKLSEFREIAYNANCRDYFSDNTISSIIEILKEVKKEYKIILGLIKSYKKVPSKLKVPFLDFPFQTGITTPEHENYIRYYIKKLLTSYEHPSVKKFNQKLMKQFTTELEELYEDANKMIKKYEKLYNISNEQELTKDPINGDYFYGMPYIDKRKILEEFMVDSTYYEIKMIHIFAHLMDIYYMRRFLDKDYITNVIGYTGALHSARYVYYLVKYFDFKVTHASYSKVSGMNKLNETIKKTKDSIDVCDLLFPPTFIQCSDMTHFPKNFE